jgi:hypothetical protein
MRAHLLAWQWSDYAAKHRHRVNLIVHIPAVALFWLGTAAVMWAAAVSHSPRRLLFGAICVAVSLVAQGRGHRFEPEAPTPFAGAGDFVTRIFAEQFVTFPRFVLSGGWYRALRQSKAR